MHHYRLLFVMGVAALALAYGSSAAALSLYNDSVSTDPPAPDQIDGTGWWDGGEPGGTYQASTLTWEITDQGSYYHYKYTFTHPEHDASYLILEVSENFGAEDVVQVYGGIGAAWEVGTYYDNGSNYQSMPGTIYGVKFDAFTSYTDNGDGTITETIEFDSVRIPTWGDFYVRCGIHPTSPGGHGEYDAAWNVGFLSGEVSGINDLNDGFHVAVPDSLIPEPGTGALLAMGLAGLGALRRAARRA